VGVDLVRVDLVRVDLIATDLMGSSCVHIFSDLSFSISFLVLRELKVRVMSKGDMFGSLFQSKRKHPTETYLLTLRKCNDCSSKKVLYSVVELKNAREVRDPKGGVGGPPQQLPPGSSPSPSLTDGQVR